MVEQSITTTLNNESLSAVAPGARGRSWGKIWPLLAVALLAGLAIWVPVTTITKYRAEQQALDVATFEEEIGIRLLRVAMTAGTGLVDFQYQILDPDKSLVVHDNEEPPQLIDEASGLVIATPFHEHAAREVHTGVTYHELFMNGSGVLKHGSTVTLIVGDSQLKHIVVQ